MYKSRVSGNLSFSAFFHKLVKIKNLEKGTALRNQRKLDAYKKMVIYRKCFHANYSKQKISTLIKLYFNNCGRESGFYNFFFQ